MQAAKFATILWGVWIFSNAFTLGYNDPAIFWSDLVAGLLIVFFASMSLSARFDWVRWINCGIGVWLLFAPLIFWAESAAAYSNDTLLGCLVIVGSALPSARDPRPDAKENPPGWNYNPSAWSQRTPIIGLALAGFFFARYLAAYQLGHIESAWDPFFGEGTERILESDVSKAFPVSDAGLGAFSYVLDALAGSIGDRRRWRTMPWMVVIFGIMIIPPGVTAITLVILQPVAVGYWCTICLAASFVMLLMVPPAIDEVVATVQFLRRAKKAGRPFWQTFWKGDDSDEQYEPMPELAPAMEQKGVSEVSVSEHGRLWHKINAFAPLHLFVSMLLGVWLMFAPTVLELSGYASDNIHFTGALVVTFAVIAMAEVGRPARFLNVLFGLWLVGSVWLFAGADTTDNWILLATGLLTSILSIPRGPVESQYGSYTRVARWGVGERRRERAKQDRDQSGRAA